MAKLPPACLVSIAPLRCTFMVAPFGRGWEG
jgi:hypothetical protein